MVKIHPTSRQGALFKQIRDGEFVDLPVDVFIEYAGYRRGLETFVRLIHQENQKLPYDFDDTSKTIWNCKVDYKTTSLEMLMYVIGRMETQKSFEVLMEFATGDYHPYVRCEAVYGLTFVYGNSGKVFSMAAGKIRSPLHILDIYSGIMVFDYCYDRIKESKAIEILDPLLYHPIWQIRLRAMYALANRKRGKQLLVGYRLSLLQEGASELDELLALRIQERLNW